MQPNRLDTGNLLHTDQFSILRVGEAKQTEIQQ